MNPPNDGLDLRRLRYFMQVMENGSVRGAAESLGMDPSAVSRAIGALEADCGLALLERRGRGVVPSDAGRLLADYAQQQGWTSPLLLWYLEYACRDDFGGSLANCSAWGTRLLKRPSLSCDR